MSKLTKDAVNKNPIVYKLFLKKISKLFLYHQILGLSTIFLLMLLLNYCSIKKQSNRKDLIWPIGFNNFKIVFILLA